MTLDILYVAWNRRAFTEFSWQMLMENTDWTQVSRMYVHDDGSEDGTYDWLRQQVKRHCPVPAEIHQGTFRSPPAVMNRMVQWTESEWFAKIDNDIVVPPGWLPAMQEGVRCGAIGNRAVELLGMEAGRGMSVTPDWDGKYRFEEGSHMGGVGLIRTECLRRRVRLVETQGRYGFTEFQHEYNPVRGWINPDLPVVSLDRVPFDPWLTLSREYVELGWQREWGTYHQQADYWENWPAWAKGEKQK